MSNLTPLPGGDMQSLDTTAVEERPVGVDLAGRASNPRSLALHHPYEPSRLGLALVAMAVPVAAAIFVLISLGEATTLVLVIVLIGVALLLLWLSLQLWRVRLLGDAILVSEKTLPELQDIIDTARARLGYTRPLRVFVVDKMSKVLSTDSAPIALMHFFGIRVLIVEGAALGDLSDELDRRRLLFTMATYIGALKARFARWWSPLFTAFHMTGLTWIARPFINPYYRATVLSGDRIAYAACGDLDISLEAVYRALVGKEVAPHLRAEGLTGQALAARRRLLLRFAQLLRPVPHATTRYLELLAFISHSSPDEFDSHRAELGVTNEDADSVLASLNRRPSHEGAARIGVALAAIVLVVGLVFGLTARQSPVAEALASAFGSQPSSDPDPSEPGGSDAPLPTDSVPNPEISTPTPTPSSTTTPFDPHVEALLALVPADLRYACQGDPVFAANTLASVTCDTQGREPASLQLFAYGTESAMRDAFKEYVGNLPEGSCEAGEPVQSYWTLSGQEQGPLACYTSKAGNTVMLWGSSENGVLALAQDPSMTLTKLYEWWMNSRINLQ